MDLDKTILLDIVKIEMPFGRFEGRKICDLPVSYLEWFQRKGFPTGRLGMLLQTTLVIKSNGLDDLLRPLKRKY